MTYSPLSKRSRLLFHWRASDYSLTPITGQTATWARAGGAGKLTDSQGRLYTPVHSQPAWIGSTEPPTLGLNAAYTNLVTSDDIDGGWTSTFTPVITASVSDPAGGTGAYTIADDDGAAATEYKYLSPSFTGDAVKVVRFVVKEASTPSSGFTRLGLYDADGTDWPLDMRIPSWSSGEPSVTETVGTLLDKWQIGSTGWWVLDCQTESVTAANDNQVHIIPASGDATYTGSISVYRVNAFDAPYPPRCILDASGTTVATTLTYPVGWTPGYGYTVYAKVRNHMLANTGVLGYLLSLGNYGAAGSALALRANSANDNWAVASRTTGTGQVTSVIGSGNVPSVGDDFEFRVSVPATGDITWGVSKSAGTEATTTHTPGTWDTAFNQLVLTIGAAYGGSSYGDLGLYDLKVAPQSGLTMAQMRAAF